jgi:hypothetical protein
MEEGVCARTSNMGRGVWVTAFAGTTHVGIMNS